MPASSRLTAGLALILIPLAASAAAPELSEAHSRRGMVVSVSPAATGAGVEILRQGGNAVDAAIAVEFALAVAWPEAGNIGGGGFMMVHPGPSRPGQPVVCLDYREAAPRRATERMFGPDDGRYTHKIVGVPGTVHGMLTAHRRYGSLKWKHLLAPAIGLARDGVPVDAALARSINRVLGIRSVRQRIHHQELVRVYGKPGGDPWQAGDRLLLPDLALTLRRIAKDKDEGFYDGKTARLIAREMKRGDGLGESGHRSPIPRERRQPRSRPAGAQSGLGSHRSNRRLPSPRAEGHPRHLPGSRCLRSPASQFRRHLCHPDAQRAGTARPEKTPSLLGSQSPHPGRDHEAGVL